MATVNEIKSGIESKMHKSVDALKVDLAAVRTGRATPSLLDKITVEYYGTPTPIPQVASVSVPEARMLVIKPWDSSSLKAIEKAIQTSDLGLNPNTAGAVIRIPMPALTEETRKNFIKHAKAEAETARVSVRNIRRDANTQLKDLLKEKTISEDDDRRAQDEVQKITDKFVAEIDKAFSVKEKDLMEI